MQEHTCRPRALRSKLLTAALLLSAGLLLCQSRCVVAGLQPAAHCFSGSGAAMLISIGDSLTNGTMNATNNATNALNGYIQHVAASFGTNDALCFMQPLLNNDEQRLNFYSLPTNLGVDGSDIFSVDGLEYYKRYGVDASFTTGRYLSDRLLPWNLRDLYDRILYPLNIAARAPVSQLDGAVWLMNAQRTNNPEGRTIVVFWMGNNDSSNAALGYGARSPTYVPLPLDMISSELSPAAAGLLAYGLQNNIVACNPYAVESITRTLTEAEDFQAQYRRCVERLVNETDGDNSSADIFLCTLPYYSSVGYLFDSEDLEFYLRKVNPGYAVPATFARVAPPGSTITDYTRGDRIALITFMCMYVLLSQGYDVAYVNRVIDDNGVQRDGLVLSEQEQAFIRERIDRFNGIIEDTAAWYGSRVHLVRTGEYLNNVLTGASEITVNGKRLTRKWGRGNAFTIDGVHPGYTAHANIANFLISAINTQLGLSAPQVDLAAVLANDPYVDRDGDGWVAGPDYQVGGIPELLFLFRDPDDDDPAAQPQMPADIWQRISAALLRLIL